MYSLKEIPLKVIIIDPNDASSQILAQTLQGMKKNILSVMQVRSLADAHSALAENDLNTIFIDPISCGIDDASEFIFSIRKLFPSIVFVLYLDFTRMEQIRTEFFARERRRLAHYFRLDKRTPIASFPDEVTATIRACQGDLSFNLSDEKITKLQNELTTIQSTTTATTASVPLSILQEIQEQLEALKGHQPKEPAIVKPKTVFLSYRFAENEYVEGLTTLLKKDGFEILTGQSANTYISQAILERIRSCEFFVCLMTRTDEKKDGTYTTSPWLLEEKGAALAMGKRIVLMVEEGVNDIGGLQGDWQRIHFTAKGFTSASIRAVDQLKSYVG
jgi:hypothetical protein